MDRAQKEAMLLDLEQYSPIPTRLLDSDLTVRDVAHIRSISEPMARRWLNDLTDQGVLLKVQAVNEETGRQVSAYRRKED